MYKRQFNVRQSSFQRTFALSVMPPPETWGAAAPNLRALKLSREDRSGGGGLNLSSPTGGSA